MFFFVAEGACHAAACAVDLAHTVPCLAQGAENSLASQQRLLMAVAMHEDPTGRLVERFRDDLAPSRRPGEELVDQERATYWLGQGAQPSERVAQLLKEAAKAAA